MLPCIVAVGHHKYGKRFPLYLREMKDLEIAYLTLFRRGELIVRIADGKKMHVTLCDP